MSFSLLNIVLCSVICIERNLAVDLKLLLVRYVHNETTKYSYHVDSSIN